MFQHAENVIWCCACPQLPYGKRIYYMTAKGVISISISNRVPYSHLTCPTELTYGWSLLLPGHRSRFNLKVGPVSDASTVVNTSTKLPMAIRPGRDRQRQVCSIESLSRERERESDDRNNPAVFRACTRLVSLNLEIKITFSSMLHAFHILATLSDYVISKQGRVSKWDVYKFTRHLTWDICMDVTTLTLYRVYTYRVLIVEIWTLQQRGFLTHVLFRFVLCFVYWTVFYDTFLFVQLQMFKYIGL